MEKLEINLKLDDCALLFAERIVLDVFLERALEDFNGVYAEALRGYLLEKHIGENSSPEILEFKITGAYLDAIALTGIFDCTYTVYFKRWEEGTPSELQAARRWDFGIELEREILWLRCED